MTDFLFFVAKTTAYRILVVVITVIITLILLGSAMDKLLIDRTRAEVVEAAAQDTIQFKTLSERQDYIDEQISLKTKDLGLDEPWYSPKRFVNTLFEVLTLDLGKSNFFTSDSGSSNVSDIIIERLPKTVLLCFWGHIWQRKGDRPLIKACHLLQSSAIALRLSGWEC